MIVRLRGTLIAVAALTAISACGSSAKTSTSTPISGGAAGHVASATKSASATSAGGGSVADAVGHAVNVCALMPASVVAQITKEPITVAKERDTPGYKLYNCNYTSASGTSGLDIDVLAEDAAIGFNADAQAAGSGNKVISGLGDKAQSNVLGVEALYGNVVIKISNLTSDTDAATLIRTLKAKL